MGRVPQIRRPGHDPAQTREPGLWPDETPPLTTAAVSAVQHVAVVAIFMIYPLVVARAGGSAQEASAVLDLHFKH